MNTDVAEDRYPHLDLAELIAHAAGRPTSDRAREHLDRCERCRVEAKRWNLVAGGVRHLASDAPAVSEHEWSKAGRQRARTARRPVLVVLSAAAALLVVAGIGSLAGIVHIRIGSQGTHPTLAAVGGCTGLEQADGTLEQVNGTSLVIQTSSGQPVTVTTTTATLVGVIGAPLDDITDGESVTVRAERSNPTIHAAVVTIGQPFNMVNPPGLAATAGTVSDATAAGFTLVTPTGSRVPVAVSDSTVVVIPHATPAQLQPGAHIFALGSPASGTTLSAKAVAAFTHLPQGTQRSVSVKDCSANSIIEALGAINQTAPNS